MVLGEFSIPDIISEANAIATQNYVEVGVMVKRYFEKAGLARISQYSPPSMNEAKLSVMAHKGLDKYGYPFPSILIYLTSFFHYSITVKFLCKILDKMDVLNVDKLNVYNVYPIDYRIRFVSFYECNSNPAVKVLDSNGFWITVFYYQNPTIRSHSAFQAAYRAVENLGNSIESGSILLCHLEEVLALHPPTLLSRYFELVLPNMKKMEYPQVYSRKIFS